MVEKLRRWVQMLVQTCCDSATGAAEVPRPAALLAAKAGLLGTLDAMLSEEWEASHPVETAERRLFVEGVLAMSK